MKFGGTSVATPEARMQAALRVISAREQGYSPMVVVSAIGRRGQPYATDTLVNLLKDIDPTVEPDAREMDLMIACGEILSAVIFAHLLKTLGQPAKAFRGGQAGIRTDGIYGNARIVAINPTLLQRAMLEGDVPVVCGFQGTYIPEPGIPGGELTTLGRGGSDTTGAALGAAMRERGYETIVEIFTDVEGVKTADPDFVKGAPTLRKVSYEEVAEIAHLGAKVVHPRAAEIAMKYDIPLWVRSTFSDDAGTEIVSSAKAPGRRVTGITHTGKLVYLSFDLKGTSEENRTELESQVYKIMAKYGLSLHMMNMSPSGIGFAVPRDQYPTLLDLVDGLVIPIKSGDKTVIYLLQIGAIPSLEAETQTKLLAPLGDVVIIPIGLTEGCTMVSTVGNEYMKQPGVFLAVLKTLHEAKVPVLQTSDSDLSLSVLIPESETERAVRLLHDKFELTSAS